MSVVWLAETLHEGRPRFRIGREGDRLVAEWDGLATFVVRRDGTTETFEAAPLADLVALAKIRQSAVPALVRHLHGGLTLHASAVAIGGAGVAFLGDSGAGKSTLAYALATRSNEDFALLSDDCLPIDGLQAMPSDSFGWIDHVARQALGISGGEGKRATAPSRVARAAVPLRRIIVLTFRDDLRLTRLAGSSVAGVLSRAMIRFVLDEPAVHVADMQRLSELASSVEVLELGRPIGLVHIDETVAAIERLC
jgi:hypothetical protein